MKSPKYHTKESKKIQSHKKVSNIKKNRLAILKGRAAKSHLILWSLQSFFIAKTSPRMQIVKAIVIEAELRAKRK